MSDHDNSDADLLAPAREDPLEPRIPTIVSGPSAAGPTAHYLSTTYEATAHPGDLAGLAAAQTLSNTAAIARSMPQSDRIIKRSVVFTLELALIGILACLLLRSSTPVETVKELGLLVLGALTGMLVNTGSTGKSSGSED